MVQRLLIAEKLIQDFLADRPDSAIAEDLRGISNELRVHISELVSEEPVERMQALYHERISARLVEIAGAMDGESMNRLNGRFGDE